MFRITLQLIAVALLGLAVPANAFRTADLTSYYTDWAQPSQGAAITTPSKLKGQSEIDGIVGGKSPVRGQAFPGCEFADDVRQREEFTVDLGRTRNLGLIRWQSAHRPKRMPASLKIEVSNTSAKGPWKVVLNVQSPNSIHTVGLNSVPARWVHVDMGINDGPGSALYRFAVFPRYTLKPATNLVKDCAPNLRHDAPELKQFWSAYDKGRYELACDELIKLWAARGSEVRDQFKPDPDAAVDERVLAIMRDEVVDGENTYRFSGGDWDWHALRAGSPTMALGWLPGAYSIFHGLANAYMATGDAKYGRKLAALLTDWLQDNPCPGWHADYDGTLIGAWVGLRASGRCGVLQRIATALAGDRSVFTRDLEMNLIYCIWEHLGLLHAIRPELAGNHLTNSNSTLFEISLKCPEFVQQKQWLQASLTSFEETFARDVLPCGREAEDSTMYVGMASSQITGQYAQVREAGLKLSPEAERKMSMLYDGVAWAHYPSGAIPTIGDCGRRSTVVPGGDFVPQDFMALYDRPDFRYMNSRGKEGTVPNATAKEAGGWYAMRTAWEERPFEDARYMFLKNSRSTPSLGRAHCHFDQLSLTLYAYGRELLTDPGMSSYGLPSNGTYKSTAYHNTVCIDGADQPQREGNDHAWANDPGADFVDCSFLSVPTALHRRQIVFLKSGRGLPDYWLVRDRVTGRGEDHNVEANWHFAEAANPVVDGRSVNSTWADGGNLMIRGVGVAVPTLGDYSIWGGKEYPARSARYQVKGIPPLSLCALLVPYKGAARPAISATEMQPDQTDPSAAAYRVVTSAGEDIIFVSSDPGKQFSFENGLLKTDAHALILRFDKSGKLVYRFSHGGTSTSYKGETVTATAGKQ